MPYLYMHFVIIQRRSVINVIRINHQFTEHTKHHSGPRLLQPYSSTSSRPSSRAKCPNGSKNTKPALSGSYSLVPLPSTSTPPPVAANENRLSRLGLFDRSGFSASSPMPPQSWSRQELENLKTSLLPNRKADRRGSRGGEEGSCPLARSVRADGGRQKKPVLQSLVVAYPSQVCHVVCCGFRKLLRRGSCE